MRTSAPRSNIDGVLIMKFLPKNCYYLNGFFIFIFIFKLSTTALAENNTIRCKTTDENNYRVWKFKYENSGIRLWTLNNDTFYPFCTVGLSVEFADGLLCAYKKDKKVGTVATFINTRKPAITDILITEDTILDDPSTWKQKIETTCELIRE